jgi:two-component system phosphate regulon sensor histidine kinase PhoR
MSEGMMIINSAGVILSINKSAKDILFGGSEVPKTILAVDITDGLRDGILEALSGKSAFNSMMRDGKHYGITVSPVKRDGAVLGAVVVMMDDTEKESREELRREFTSNVSHELKTPLTSISGFAELIRDGIADGEDVKKFAGNIYSEAQRLVSLVGDIIRLTQLDGAEAPFDGEVSLLEICREVTDRIAIVAKNKEITVTVDESSDTGMVLGNMQILEEIVYNLVDNGIKYNSQGGYVNISVQTTDDGVRLGVADNGIGIPPSHRDRVFERFYRVDKSHSKNIGGTGLGLSIVKHAAMYHGAKVSLESEEGRGTTVSVLFPRR